MFWRKFKDTHLQNKITLNRC